MKNFSLEGDDIYSAEELLEKLLSAISSAVFLIDAQDYRILDCNEAACEITGYSREELVGSISSYLHVDEEHLSRYREIVFREIKEIGALRNFRYKLKRKNGEIFNGLLNIIPLHNKSGEVIGWVGTADDITSKILTESELNIRNQAFETASEAFLFADKNGLITHINKSLLDLWGYSSAEELTGKDTSELFKEPLEFSALLNALANNKLQRGELTARRKDGSAFIARAAISIVMGADGQPNRIMASFMDISEQKAADLERANYQRRLKSLVAHLAKLQNKERREISMRIHDGIAQYLTALKMRIGVLKIKAETAGISADLSPINEIINDTIEATRSLMYELNPPAISEAGFISGVKWLIEKAERRGNIKFSLTAKGEPRITDEETKVILFKAIKELIENIAGHSGGSLAKIEINSEADPLEISVEDDGIGFDSQNLGEASEKQGGFGLFNITEIITQLGGSLIINSKQGRGTKIKITISTKGRGD